MSTHKAATAGIYIVLSVFWPKRLENAGFFALYFSTHMGRGVVLHIGTTPRLFKLFSFIQWPIVGHVSQVHLYIAVEDQIGIAHRVMGEQIIQL